MIKPTFIIVLLFYYSSYIHGITLEDAVDLALMQNRSLQSSRLSVKQSTYTKRSAFSNILPKINLSSTMIHLDGGTFDKMKMGYNYSYSRYIAETALGIPSKPPDSVYQRTYMTKLTVTQPIWNGGVIWHGYRMAKLAEDVSKVQHKSNRIALQYNVASVYFSLLKMQELLKVNKQSLIKSRTNLRTTQTQVLAGTAIRSDLLQYKVKVLEKEKDLLITKNTISILKTKWRNLLGLKPSADIPMPDAVSLLKYKQEIMQYASWDNNEVEQAWLEQKNKVLKSNPNIILLKEKVHLSKLAYRSTLGSFSPTLNFSWTKTIEQDEKLDFKGDGSWNVALALSVPIFNGSSRIWNVAKSKTAIDQAELNRADGEANILIGAKNAFITMINAAKQLVISEQSLKNAKIQYKQIHDLHRAGMTTISKLIDADIILYGSEMSLSSSRYDFVLARLAWLQFLNKGVR